jgi:tungstate transport system substrate-binding protein
MVVTRRAFVALLLALSAFAAGAQDKSIVVASTTSTEQSGLFGYLLPIATTDDPGEGGRARHGHVDLATPGDAERRSSMPVRRKFIAEGKAALSVMYNDSR